MKCPECGSHCWHNEVDVGVGFICDEWKCEECDWSEDQGYPMEDYNWEEWLEGGNDYEIYCD